MCKYNFELDLNANDTMPKIIAHIKNYSDVLEFGSANGRLTKFLNYEKKCNVDIIEYDEIAGEESSKYSRYSCIGKYDGDIENYRWQEILYGNKYDYIIFADVLEHLQDPYNVLCSSRKFMKEDGRIIVSVPNIAHNSIIGQLFLDRFEYMETGLLDSSHIHFFSYNSVKEMIDKAGFEIYEEDAVIHQINETEFNLSMNDFSYAENKALSEHLYGQVYQFLFFLKQGEIIPESDKVNKLLNIQSNCFVKYFWTNAENETFDEKKSKIVFINPKERFFKILVRKNIFKLKIIPVPTPCMIIINKILINNGINYKEVNYVSNGITLIDRDIIVGGNEYEIMCETINDYVECIDLTIQIIEYKRNYFNTIYDTIIKIEEEKKYISNSCNKQEKIIADLVKNKDNMEEEICSLKEEICSLKEEINEIVFVRDKLDSERIEFTEINNRLNFEVEKLNAELISIYDSKWYKIISKIRKLFGRE